MRRLSFQIQIAGMILIALFMGYSFQAVDFLGIKEKNPVSEIGKTPRPFRTLAGVWMVDLTFHKNQTPEINEILRLEEGRMTSTQAGDSNIQIMDAEGNQIFDQSFQTVFLIGEPQRNIEEVDMIFVLPILDNGRIIKVVTPHGEVSRELPISE